MTLMRVKNKNIDYHVIVGLLYREIQTRFGSKQFGYFWGIFDAMLMIIIFAGLKKIVSSNSMLHLDFTVFLAIGFLSFFLWKNIVNKSLTAFSANKALFLYQRVRPYHTLLTRLFLEVLISISTIFIFLFIGWFFGFDLSIDNFLFTILSLGWLIVFGFSIGFLSSILSELYEIYAKVMNILLSPLLFISAIMYSVESLPPKLQEVILYNPLVHFMELIHGFYFKSLNTNHVDFEYIFYWTVVPLILGLYLYRKHEERIISS